MLTEYVSQAARADHCLLLCQNNRSKKNLQYVVLAVYYCAAGLNANTGTCFEKQLQLIREHVTKSNYNLASKYVLQSMSETATCYSSNQRRVVKDGVQNRAEKALRSL